MIEAIANLHIPASGTSATAIAPQANVDAFTNLLGSDNQVQGAIRSFVNNAENRIERGQLHVSEKLREFSYKDNVTSLVGAMHESSMNSVSIQLTGKIGTKVSENFESLIKQQ